MHFSDVFGPFNLLFGAIFLGGQNGLFRTLKCTFWNFRISGSAWGRDDCKIRGKVPNLPWSLPSQPTPPKLRRWQFAPLNQRLRHSLPVQRQILRTGHVPEKIMQNLCAGHSRQVPENCAKDVRGPPKMCWDCAKFVRGCTCTIRADYWGGFPRMCVHKCRAIFLLRFEIFSETKLYGQKMSQIKGVGLLVAPYCAIPRDYLSDTPLLRAMGFWCLNMANWVRYPLPLFWAFPPWRACEVEVRYPPPSKGVSQRYLRDTPWKQGEWVRYPPLRYYLERVLHDMGGYLALGR